MRDPYEVLGVPRGASAAAIKSAYRKLAKIFLAGVQLASAMILLN